MRRIEFIISDLFGYSPQTYFNWKKEIDKRPILKLIDKYFTKEELEEFLLTGKIAKQELIKDKSLHELEECFKDKQNEKVLEEINLKMQEIENLKKQLV